MKNIVMALAAAATLAAVSGTSASAAPAFAGGIGAEPNPLLQDVRVFCYNRYTGRFLHWGRCGGGYRRPVSRPRVYCYNRYNGRFLHWGRCRR